MGKTSTMQVEIRFGDCDPAGIVYFPRYHRWMDAASLHFFMSFGVPPWHVLEHTSGIIGTPLLELYLMVNAAHRVLKGAGVKVARHLTGSLVTSLEMAGCSITVSAVDAAALALWDAPVHTPALRWGM